MSYRHKYEISQKTSTFSINILDHVKQRSKLIHFFELSVNLCLKIYSSYVNPVFKLQQNHIYYNVLSGDGIPPYNRPRG